MLHILSYLMNNGQEVTKNRKNSKETKLYL